MWDMPSELIVAIFPSRTILVKALDHIIQLRDINILHAAVVSRAKDGEIVVVGDDISADEGGIAGGTLGAAISALGIVQLGALALPGVGPIIALGASVLVGGLIGHFTGRFAADLVDFSFKRDQMEALSAQLKEGHPAIVLEVDDPYAVEARLRQELSAFRAELVERLPARA